MKNKIIFPYFENGVFTGVRVTIGNEDFIIMSKNYNNGLRMAGKDVIKSLKEDGLSTWNFQQVCFVMAYYKEINALLINNGGDSLNDVFWTCSKCSPDEIYIYVGQMNMIDCDIYLNQSPKFKVRIIKNLKK